MNAARRRESHDPARGAGVLAHGSSRPTSPSSRPTSSSSRPTSPAAGPCLLVALALLACPAIPRSCPGIPRSSAQRLGAEEAPPGARENAKAKQKAKARKDLAGIQPGPSRSAPPAPADPLPAELTRALEDARKELEAVKSAAAAESARLGDEVAAETTAATDRRAEERRLTLALRKLEADAVELEQKLATATDARSRAADALNLTKGELEAQAAAWKDRFAGTLLAVQHPDLLQSVEEAHRDASGEITGRVERLLDAFARTVRLGREAGIFEAPVQLSSQGGKVEVCRVLRLGFLSGYYLQPERGEAGLITTDPERRSGFVGESAPLSAAERASVARAIERPEAGGLLPIDVTGGLGLAALQTQDSLARWFELGGWCMWPLLAIAITAFLLVIERAVVLAVKSAGIERRIRKVMALIDAGRPDEAEALAARMGGAVGGVLSAALVHRDRDRSVMEDAVQEALLHHAPSFQTRLSFIALCSAVSPLLGLLGTVTGMITTFKMVTLFGTSDPRFLAGGISEALITTQAGLCIAIPALLARGVLGAVAENAVGKLESGALSVVIALLKARGESVPADEEPLEVEGPA